LLPDRGFGFVLLSNRSDAPLLPKTVDAVLALAALSEQIPAPAELEPDAESFAAYAGHYEDRDFAGAVDVSVQDNELNFSGAALDSAGIEYERRLKPTTLDNFTLSIEGLDLPVTFIRDDSGRFVWLRGRHFVASRADEP